jgi:hypothetical protein
MSRTARTMIAKAFGAEVEYKTAGNYACAAVIQYTRDGEFRRYVAAVGNSPASVGNRGRKVLRRVRPETLPSDYPYLIEVVTLREKTAPLVHGYFGTHNALVTALFISGRGWVRFDEQPWSAGASVLRKMIREDGVTAFEFTVPRSQRYADFTSDELLRSMNARKKA